MFFFSLDKNNFSHDQKLNPRNDRWLCADLSDATHVMQTKFHTSVTVLRVVSSNEHIMPPYFFQRGLLLIASGCIDVLGTVVMSWIGLVCDGRLYMFHSAPAHKAVVT